MRLNLMKVYMPHCSTYHHNSTNNLYGIKKYIVHVPQYIPQMMPVSYTWTPDNKLHSAISRHSILLVMVLDTVTSLFPIKQVAW